ncbi:hypothetical protein [Mycolicibacterium sp.]|uniref:hypothetical protein n=1 Tax=Mycolicibacterium sp. TaxID=2320850 RepID=UPI0028A9EF49|nr:hypothetical protein [Mycolicibacterium sp.]
MTIAEAVADLDRLLGDIAATQYLLDDAIEERDALRRKVHQLQGELNGLRSRLADWHAGMSWRAYR